MSDSFVNETREEITAIDREIVALVNRRLEVVARLKRHKAEHGIAFVDPQREEQMVEERVRDNAGPLSDDGLRVFYTELLALTKRELA
jgi:chorismate mutase / prephenate dehydratase